MREKKIEIKGPNLPLDPIVGELDSEYSEIKAAHDALLTEFKRLEEMGKFGQLEYELEFRLRRTYINPATGEQEYRPDDDVGEGLICLGSRDHNPKREDFDD